MQKCRIFIGVIVWTAAAIAGIVLLPGIARTESKRETIRSLATYAFRSSTDHTVQSDEPIVAAVGDPVFVIDLEGGMKQVGEVRQLIVDGELNERSIKSVTEFNVLLYPDAYDPQRPVSLRYYRTPETLSWVVRTLLPAERREEIQQEIRLAMEQHQDDVVAALKPLLAQAAADAFEVVKEDLPKTLTRKKDVLNRLGERYQVAIVEQQLVPLIKEEIWPIVRHHAEPVARDIGDEMWDKVSLWSFGWRAAYDRSPLPEKQLLEQEWNRFVQQEAMPILSKHSKDYIEVVRRVVRDTAQNRRTREVLAGSFSLVTRDPEFRQLLWDVLDEVVVNNPRFHAVLAESWSRPEAQKAIQEVAKKLEPSVRRIGDNVFGTLQGGITDEFAGVLRTQILWKDRRWFVLEQSLEDGPLEHEAIPLVVADPSQVERQVFLRYRSRR